MSHSTAPRLRPQLHRTRHHPAPEPDFGLDGILDAAVASSLKEGGARWKEITYTPLLTFWAFFWQMLSPDKSCRAATKRIAADGVGDRPDRYEPRAWKRRPKPQKFLMEPRKEARKRLLKAG
jgi:hypothetical protein